MGRFTSLDHASDPFPLATFQSGWDREGTGEPDNLFVRIYRQNHI